MRHRWWVAALAAVLVLMAGCKGSHNQNSTDMRALNAVVDAEPLDVLVDDDVKAAALSLGNASSYSEFAAGTRDVKVRSSTNQAVLVDKNVSFASGVNSTMVIYGKRAAINTLLLTDDTVNPSSGHFKVRLVGLSPDAGAVDLYLTTGSDISSAPPIFSSVGYGAAPDYVEVSPGTFHITYTTAGTKDILFQSNALVFAEGAKPTLGVFPAVGGKLVNAVLLTPGTDGTSTFMPNPFARLKAVNAVPDSTALTFKADGATLLSNVPFMGSSSYVTTATGAHTLQVEASNVPGTALTTLSRSLDPAHDYSMVALNTLGQIRLVTFTDDNTVPVAGFAKVRFANALSGSTVVDVLVNFASQTTGLAFASASPYFQLAASATTTYTITFATSGGVSVISTIDSGILDTGGVYTVYLFGTATSPLAKVIRDR